MNADFNEAMSLWLFVSVKLSNLEKFTTLPFINRMEIILNELPVEISYLFMVNEMFNRTQNEILEFCYSVQDVADNYIQSLNHFEVASNASDHSDFGLLTSREESSSSSRGNRSRRGRTRGQGRICKQRKPLSTIPETGRLEFSDMISNSSVSTWSTRSTRSTRSSRSTMSNCIAESA